MKRTILLLPALFLLVTAACVNDDATLDELIRNNKPDSTIVPVDTVQPIDIQLDYSDLEEPDDVVPTDEADPAYNDYHENTDWNWTVTITYDGDTARLSGNTSRVRYTVKGADVTINSTSSRMQYVATGQSDDGSLKIYSENKFKLTLDGLNLTNTEGAAINNQCGKTCYLVLADDTENNLADGPAYTYVTGEDQKGAFFSEGQVIVSGRGTLNITANGGHGMACDDYFRFRPGCKINITANAGHAIKSNDGVWMDGGVLNLLASANGTRGIKCDASVYIAGGRLTAITAGDSRIEPATELAQADTTSAAGIKADTAVVITGGTVMLRSTGEGAKGINAGQNIDITAGTVKVVTTGAKVNSAPKAIKCDGVINITGGYVYAYSANSKPIDADIALNVAEGYTTYETLEKRVIIQFPTSDVSAKPRRP